MTCSSTFFYIIHRADVQKRAQFSRTAPACTALALSGSLPRASVACADAHSAACPRRSAQQSSGYTCAGRCGGNPRKPPPHALCTPQRHGCNAVRAPRRAACTGGAALACSAGPVLPQWSCSSEETRCAADSADSSSLEAVRHRRSPSLGSALSKRSSDADASPICTSSRRTAPCARCRPPPCTIPRENGASHQCSPQHDSDWMTPAK
jgi:hypothetical protein